MAIDKTSKVLGDMPAIIQQPDQDEAAPQRKSIADPGAVLQPPIIESRVLRATRLDWDRPGDASPTAPR
jgi:hypothetical protein